MNKEDIYLIGMIIGRAKNHDDPNVYAANCVAELEAATKQAEVEAKKRAAAKDADKKASRDAEDKTRKSARDAEDKDDYEPHYGRKKEAE